MNYERINQAVQFATMAHEGQKRKVTSLSYITHPYTAALYVIDALQDLSLDEQVKENIVIATLLHDVAEDTKYDLEAIKDAFGSEVATLVTQSSEPDKEKSWKERKQHTINQLTNASFEVKCIVCADKTHNLLSILQDYEQNREEVWKKFNAPKTEQQWYYSSISEALMTNVSHPPTLFTTYKQLVMKLFHT
ncbi:HD domain-containing protein [Metabacillus iocasae]|uniref:(P)ppGpp synthase/HD superfamily hydrolase n=1 Tax=Priestia iocasae TaxID=2291674 RepID=A0ABS2QVA4_9BACI|nr:(p)ppGpp synthase/HD superfamily hydrolase [Metabacillus iocasae]